MYTPPEAVSSAVRQRQTSSVRRDDVADANFPVDGSTHYKPVSMLTVSALSLQIQSTPIEIGASARICWR
jgi:hypothetical protein